MIVSLFGLSFSCASRTISFEQRFRGVLIELGDFTKALAALQKSLNAHYNVERLARIGVVHALQGRKDKARQIIKRIQSKSNNNSIKSAMIYLALDDKEKAYDFLDQAFEQHEVDLVALGSDPRWKTIRHEPRFKALMAKVGLPVGPHKSAK